MSEPPRAPADRLFTIQNPEAYAFQTGRSPRGEQVLMGLIDESVVAVFFSGSGRYLRSEDRPVDFEPSPDEPPGRRREARVAFFRSALQTWADELGLIPGMIRVYPFWLRAWGVGIAGLPDFWVRFLGDPLSVDEKWRTQWLQEISEWQRDGNFILKWDSEYWMDKDGNVSAT